MIFDKPWTWIALGVGVAVGVGLGVWDGVREAKKKREAEGGECPFDTLLRDQLVYDTVTLDTLKSLLTVEEGVLASVSLMSEDWLRKLQCPSPEEVDPSKLLVVAHYNEDTDEMLDVRLVSFVSLEESLRERLEASGGTIVIGM